MNICKAVAQDLGTMYARAKNINSCDTFGRATTDFFVASGDKIKAVFTTAVGYLKTAFESVKKIWDDKIAPEYKHIKLWHLGLLATALIPLIAIPCILGPEAIPIGIVAGALPVLAAAALWWRNRNYNLNQDLTNKLGETLDELTTLLEEKTQEDNVKLQELQNTETPKIVQENTQKDEVKIEEVQNTETPNVEKSPPLNKEGHSIQWDRILQLKPSLNDFASTNWKENIADLNKMVKDLRGMQGDKFKEEHELTVGFVKSLKKRLHVIDKETNKYITSYKATSKDKKTQNENVVDKKTEMVEKSHGLFGA